MATHDLLSVTITPDAVAPEVSLHAVVLLSIDRDPTRGADVTLTPDADVVVAQSAPSIVAAVQVYLDLGAGLQLLSGGDFDPKSAAAEEDLDGDVDQSTFDLVGSRFSPLISAALRGKAAARLDWLFGTPGAVVTRQMFEGHVHGVTFGTRERRASVTMLDAGARLSELRVNIKLEAEHGRTRQQVMQDLATEHGFELGAFDLGPRGEVRLQKPLDLIQVGLFEFAREFLSPCGVHLYVAEGKLCAMRVSALRTIRRDIYARDIVPGSLQLTPPSSSTANEFSVTYTTYDLSEVEGEITETTWQRRYAVYAPRVATRIQSGTFGVVTEDEYVSQTPEEATYRLVGVTSTTTTRRGTIVTRQGVQEWGYGWPQTPRLQLTNLGEAEPRGGTYYGSDEGTWHETDRERWMYLRRAVTTRTIDVESGLVTRELTVRNYYRWRRLFVAATTTDSWYAGRLLSEAGDGVDGTEILRVSESGVALSEFGGGSPNDEEDEILWTHNADGEIETETSILRRWMPGSAAGITRLYNIDDLRRFGGDYEYLQAVATETTQYVSAANQQSYVVTRRLSATDPRTAERRTETVSEDMSGNRPEGQRYDATLIASQHETVTGSDPTRQLLSGIIADDAEGSEYCETAEDADELLRYRLRESGAIDIQMTVPLESLLHKGQWIRLWDNPAVGLSGVTLLLTRVSRSWGASTQEMSGRLYPEELL